MILFLSPLEGGGGGGLQEFRELSFTDVECMGQLMNIPLLDSKKKNNL